VLCGASSDAPPFLTGTAMIDLSKISAIDVHVHAEI